MPDFARPSRRANPCPDWLSDVFIVKNHHTFPRRPGKNMGSSGIRYGSIAQFFHWCTAILVLVAFVYGPGGPEQRVYLSVHEIDRRRHETLGLCVFAQRVRFATACSGQSLYRLVRWLKKLARAWGRAASRERHKKPCSENREASLARIMEKKVSRWITAVTRYNRSVNRARSSPDLIRVDWCPLPK